jgi:hypothetical protein
LALGAGMIGGNLRIVVLAASLIGGAGIQPVSAELPGLGEKKWLGHFIGFENKKFEYGFTVQGRSLIRVIGAKDVPVIQKLAIQVDFLVEEILPDGKTYVRFIVPESLESAQAAGNDPKNVVIRGKVKGDAAFEVSVNEDHGVISLGGRLVDRGTLVKNPVRFSIRVKFPNAYPYAKKGGDRKEAKAFAEVTKNDRIQLTWTDGKRVKLPTDKPADGGSKEVNGPGIASAQIEFSPYDRKKVECTASENSLLTLSTEQAAPLHDGFSLTWVADPAKDPEGRARLSLDVK